MSANIPDEMHLLQPLWSRLDMSNNNLKVTVSSEILSCCEEALILSNNSLTVPVPNSEEEQLTVIKVNSNGNAFSGEIPLESLWRGLSDTNTAATWSDYLEKLLLNDNMLSGESPTESGSMKILTSLLPQNNALTFYIDCVLWWDYIPFQMKIHRWRTWFDLTTLLTTSSQ